MTHAASLLVVFGARLNDAASSIARVTTDLRRSHTMLGTLGLLALYFRDYSMGSGRASAYRSRQVPASSRRFERH
jgi:hypothetical protein